MGMSNVSYGNCSFLTMNMKQNQSKSFFDYPLKEKKAIIRKAAIEGAKAQKALMDRAEKWEKRESIGRYHLEVKTDAPHSVILHRDDGETWSDHARAMSHLMQELSSQKQAIWEMVEGMKKYPPYTFHTERLPYKRALSDVQERIMGI